MILPHNNLTPKKTVNIVTCNFGNMYNNSSAFICPQVECYDISVSSYTEMNFPSRHNSLHPRLKGKIPKMLQSKYFDADYYIWVDSKFNIVSPYFVTWLIDSLNGKEIAFFKHPQRSSIREEIEMMCELMDNNDEYLLDRYDGEPMQDQVSYYISDNTFEDNILISAGMFIYTKNFIKNYPSFMSDWLLENLVWSVQDQLSLPYVLHKHKVEYSLIEGDIISNNYVIYG